jgi:hypothetical protein
MEEKRYSAAELALLVSLHRQGLEPCILFAVKNSGGTRTSRIIGFGTPPLDLTVGQPFILVGKSLTLDPAIAERYVATSALVSIDKEDGEVESYVLRTRTGSIYRVVYASVEGEEQ